MNLEDVIDPDYGFRTDEFSNRNPTYGDENQLTVVGWSGKQHEMKFYILRCSICMQDKELYGDGFFKAVKGSLTKQSFPCGCSKAPRFSKLQNEILCKRLANSEGLSFMGFHGEWKGKFTKILLECDKHGSWSSSNLDNFLNSGRRCPKCRYDRVSESKTAPDDIFIEEFLATGKFHEETLFKRSKRRGKEFSKGIWTIYCPKCKDTCQVSGTSLKKGCVPCSCGISGQKQAYIAIVTEISTNDRFIKFGISGNIKYRHKVLNRKKNYSLELESVYSFSSVENCKGAERDCKKSIPCGVVSSEYFGGGWTETVRLEDIDNIKSIFEEYGGFLTDEY